MSTKVEKVMLEQDLGLTRSGGVCKEGGWLICGRVDCEMVL